MNSTSSQKKDRIGSRSRSIARVMNEFDTGTPRQKFEELIVHSCITRFSSIRTSQQHPFESACFGSDLLISSCVRVLWTKFLTMKSSQRRQYVPNGQSLHFSLDGVCIPENFNTKVAVLLAQTIHREMEHDIFMYQHKEHNAHNTFASGYFLPHDKRKKRVFLLDDTGSSGKTMIDLVTFVRDKGASVAGIILFIDRSVTVEGKDVMLSQYLKTICRTDVYSITSAKSLNDKFSEAAMRAGEAPDEIEKMLAREW